MADLERPVILFDGVCNLCSGTVKWVIKNDPAGRFDFASLQSEAARRVLKGQDPGLDSILLVDSAGVHTRSEAVLRIARMLRMPWPVLTVFRIFPRFLRDALYRWVGRNRYRWFGKSESCMLPTPELRARFLDWGEAQS